MALLAGAIAMTYEFGKGVSTNTTTSRVVSSGAVLTNMKELLGNFSQLKFNYVVNSSIPSQDANASISYYLVGHPAINGTTLTEYGFVFSTSQQSNSSFVYYDSNGKIVLATINGENFTGVNTVFADYLLLPFNILLNFQQYFFENSTVFSSFMPIDSSSGEGFGNVTMSVITYHATQIHYQGDIAQEMTVKVGRPLGNLELTTFVSIQGEMSGGQNQGSLVVYLVSATLAQE